MFRSQQSSAQSSPFAPPPQQQQSAANFGAHNGNQLPFATTQNAPFQPFYSAPPMTTAAFALSAPPARVQAPPNFSPLFNSPGAFQMPPMQQQPTAMAALDAFGAPVTPFAAHQFQNQQQPQQSGWTAAFASAGPIQIGPTQSGATLGAAAFASPSPASSTASGPTSG